MLLENDSSWTVATFVTNSTDSSTPNFIILKFAVQIKKFLMAFKVIHLLFHIYGGRLLMDMERQLDVFVFKVLLTMLAILILYLELITADSIRIFK